jgi:hypothetical protein
LLTVVIAVRQRRIAGRTSAHHFQIVLGGPPILQRARERHPGATPRIITDNGPQFLAKDFKEFIRQAGMTHVKTSPYYPQSNGKIERWHKSLKGDCIRVKVPLSLEDARRIVGDYVVHYNDVRLHSALGYVAPRDRLQGRHLDIGDERDRKLAEARERRKRLRQAEHAQRDRQECQPTVTPPAPRTPRPAIDFAAVRALITMAAVLELLGWKPRSAHGARRAQQRGNCPLHGSAAGTSRCFSVNLDQHLFHCFKCGRSGNALDLWAHATGQSPYDAAIDLCRRLSIPLPILPPPPRQRNREEETVVVGPSSGTMASS